MTIAVAQDGEFKTVTGHWVSSGGQWHEVKTGGGIPPAAPLDVLIGHDGAGSGLLEWRAPANVDDPPLAKFQVYYAIKSEFNPLDPPMEADWIDAGEVVYVSGTSIYSFSFSTAAALPGNAVYGSVVSVGPDGAMSSRNMDVNPVVPDPLPGQPINCFGAWTDSVTNSVHWESPIEFGNAVTYVLEYSVAGQIDAPGSGTFIAEVAAVDGTPNDYIHTKTAGEGDLLHHYAVYGKRADGLTGDLARFVVDVAKPSRPNTFVATTIDQTQIGLSWAAPVEQVNWTGTYRLSFKLGDYPVGPEDPTATILLDNVADVAYTHTGLTPDTYYYYCCAAYSSISTPTGNFGDPALAYKKTKAPIPGPPGAPINFLEVGNMPVWWNSWVCFSFQNFPGYPYEYYGGHTFRYQMHTDPGLTSGVAINKLQVFGDSWQYVAFAAGSEVGNLCISVQALGKDGASNSGTYLPGAIYITPPATAADVAAVAFEDVPEADINYALFWLDRLDLPSAALDSIDEVWESLELVLNYDLTSADVWMAVWTLGNILMNVTPPSDEVIDLIISERDVIPEGLDALLQIKESLEAISDADRDMDVVGVYLSRAGSGIGQLLSDGSWPEPEELEV